MPGRSRALAAVALALLTSAFSRPAAAESVAQTQEIPLGTPAADDPRMRPNAHERRAGIVLGVAPGIGLAGASGYPNNAKLLGNPDFYSQSPMLVGASTSYFLLGALTDYLSFGPLVNVASFESDKWKSTGYALGFRLEVFPLYRVLPTFADTSLYGQVGAGKSVLQANGPYPTAEGFQSFLGIGLHHEFRLFRMLGGHAVGGPYVEYDATRAESAERHWFTVGLRVAWYGGRVQADLK